MKANRGSAIQSAVIILLLLAVGILLVALMRKGEAEKGRARDEITARAGKDSAAGGKTVGEGKAGDASLPKQANESRTGGGAPHETLARGNVPLQSSDTQGVSSEGGEPANLRKGSGIIEFRDGSTQEFFSFRPCYWKSHHAWTVPFNNTSRSVPLTIVKTITVGPRASAKSTLYEVDIETTTGYTFTYVEHKTALGECVIVMIDDEITGTRKEQNVSVSVIRQIRIVR